eukprot:TRINITY_DN125_c0_g1_i2.p2 TRINITY_DN125_c0_g1~~TRINITY_DN125_c0_g1_i2.p2  ORF type:complete len:119 (+),score=22.64 TRINITY_DN125_c0_g1_i2:735-1091(+)
MFSALTIVLPTFHLDIKKKKNPICNGKPEQPSAKRLKISGKPLPSITKAKKTKLTFTASAAQCRPPTVIDVDITASCMEVSPIPMEEADIFTWTMDDLMQIYSGLPTECEILHWLEEC